MVYSNRKATEQYDLSDDERTSPLDPYLSPPPPASGPIDPLNFLS